MTFPQQQPNSQITPQSVGLPGPSPTASTNSGLSPFGQPMSQATTVTSQFPVTSNGPSSLPSASPVGGAAQNQFNDVMKGRLAPSPSAFSLQSQLNSVSAAGGTTSVGTRLPTNSGTDTLMTTHISAAGPTSVSSSKGGSPAPATPAVSSPNTASNLGKYILIFFLQIEETRFY